MNTVCREIGGDSSDSACRVMVYLLHDDQQGELDLSGLSDSEYQRANRYRVVEKRRQFLFTRSAGRLVLATHFGVPAQDIEWNVSGPPAIGVGGTPLNACCSCSHSGDFSVLAVASPHVRIGVDLEQSDQQIHIPALAATSLTPAERQLLARCSESVQHTLLLRSWILKEALLKTLNQTPPPNPQALELCWRDENLLERINWHLPPMESDSAGNSGFWAVGWLDGILQGNSPEISLALALWDRSRIGMQKGDLSPDAGLGRFKFQRIQPAGPDFLPKPSILTGTFIATI